MAMLFQALPVPHIDWNIDLGNILTILGFVWGFYKFNQSNNIKRAKQHSDNLLALQKISNKLDIMWEWFAEEHLRGKKR